MVKLFAMLMALLMSAGVSSGEIDPGHVDLDITDYGAQITLISRSGTISLSAASGKIEVVIMYEFRYVDGHIEVFLNGQFQFSADTMREARKELEQYGEV